jgi:hypothetical protein
MNDPKPLPPRESLPPDPEDGMPASVGVATMAPDGTLKLMLRTETEDGLVGEMVMIVPPGDRRYADMVRHLSGIVPGQARPIPPFPEPEIDPSSI